MQLARVAQTAKYVGMSLPVKPLPKPLAGRPFTQREGIEQGISRKALRHSQFEIPFQGVRVHSASAPKGSRELENRARAFGLLLRSDEAFSHETALMLLGCPLYPSQDRRLHVTVPSPKNARRAKGICGHKVNAPFVVWQRADGVKVVPPLLALAQSATTLRLRELVVAIDSLLLPRHNQNPLVSRDSLSEELRSSSRRGIRELRHAAGFARVGAESRMESLLRLTLAAYGLAEHFELQVDVSDEAGWIGRFDMVCIRCKLVVEYDGEQHRTDRAQYLKDLRRLDRVRGAGYRVIRVHAGELLSDPAQVARLVASELGLEFVLELRHPELLA